MTASAPGLLISQLGRQEIRRIVNQGTRKVL